MQTASATSAALQFVEKAHEAPAHTKHTNPRTFALLLLPVPASASERAVDKEVVIRATVDEAKAASTTRDGIVAFIAPDARIEPRMGGAFAIHIDPGAPPCLKGADGMSYLALQPKQMLSFG